MPSSKLNLRKLQQLAGRALQNGIALHFDSVLLHQNGSYGTAFFISVLAMEEIGKAYWADHYAWTEKVHRNSDVDREVEWLAALFGDHRDKQLAFLRQVPESWNTPFLGYVASKQLDRKKQNAVYVGLSKPAKGKPRTEGSITTPMQMTRVHSHRQILMVQDFLIEQIEGINRGSIEYDLTAFTNTLSNELLTQLKSAGLC